jgi:hypothetical protein
MKEFDIRTDGESNSVAVICDALAKNAINIDALSINGDIVRLVTEDERSTTEILNKLNARFSINDILKIRMLDRPGELSKTLRILEKYSIKTEAVYILDKDKERGETHVAMKVNDLEKARGLLG